MRHKTATIRGGNWRGQSPDLFSLAVGQNLRLQPSGYFTVASSRYYVGNREANPGVGAPRYQRVVFPSVLSP